MNNTKPDRLVFASDNYAGICPEAMEYFVRANEGFDRPYGDDKWTEEARDLFKEIFEADCEIFFVHNGTAANALSLATLCQPYQGIICNTFAHIENNECGATQFYSQGAKLIVDNDRGNKLRPESIARILVSRTDVHYQKIEALSVTQATEMGLVYTTEELKQINKIAKENNLKLHMDGARLANAIAALDVQPEEITRQCGIDVLSFGATKNGIAGGEALVFFNKELAKEFSYRCKQSGQLTSKMRFVAAQWVGMLKTGAWLKNAQHANDFALQLRKKLEDFSCLQFIYDTVTNAVILKMPEGVEKLMRELGWHFYTFTDDGAVRLMCSWATTSQMIDDFVKDLRSCL